jgi:uncharacterized protein YggT (Ycf19 family)
MDKKINGGTGVSRRTEFLRVSRWLVLFLYGFVMLAVTILVIAFFLRLFNANVSAPFVEWIYRNTTIIMQPFRGIFPPVKGESGSVLDVSILFGILMYLLFGMAVHALIDAIDRRLPLPRRPSVTNSR